MSRELSKNNSKERKRPPKVLLKFTKLNCGSFTYLPSLKNTELYVNSYYNNELKLAILRTTLTKNASYKITGTLDFHFICLLIDFRIQRPVKKICFQFSRRKSLLFFLPCILQWSAIARSLANHWLIVDDMVIENFKK